MSGNFTFELLCIDPDDIINQEAFIHALSYSKEVWNGNSPINQELANLRVVRGISFSQFCYHAP